MKIIPYNEHERVETGPIQFGESDWPGAFIRGDNAMGYIYYLDQAISRLEKDNRNTPNDVK